MKFFLIIFWISFAQCGNAQKFNSFQFKKWELMIGEEIDLKKFIAFKEEEKKKYLKIAFPYNVSHRAKVDSFYYNGLKTQGPWLCIANKRISAIVFFLNCDADIYELLVKELGEASYSQAPFLDRDSKTKLLYIWDKEKVNIIFSLNPSSFGNIESAIISVQNKNSSLSLQEFNIEVSSF